LEGTLGAVVLFFVFVVAPLLEIVTAVSLAKAIGWGAVLTEMAVAGVAGVFVVRAVGLSVWRRVRRVLDQERLPGDETADALLILLAGVLLVVPGLLSDLAALLLLFPPTRAAARRSALRRWRERVQVSSDYIDVESTGDGVHTPRRPLGP